MTDLTLSVSVQQTAPFPLDASFACRPGQVLAIFGPSGAGKTTILRCIAGLHRATRARIVSGDDVWADTASGHEEPPHRRAVGFVAQDYALFPHMTALENVMAPLGGRSRHERQDEARRLLALVHLDRSHNRRPASLSGGEQQRVALARALAREPRVLLLDEPFAATDRAIRRQLQDELDDIRRRLRIPVVIVTHDFDDVVRLATDVVLIDKGRTIAQSTLEELTSRPDLAWLHAATGFGSVFTASVSSRDERRGLATLAFDGGVLFVALDGLTAGSEVRVRVPARDVILAAERPVGISLHNILDGVVTEIHSGVDGHHAVVQLAIGPTRLLAEVTQDAVARLGLAPGRASLALIKSVAVEVIPTHSVAPLALP